jgi:hypothetical protein
MGFHGGVEELHEIWGEEPHHDPVAAERPAEQERAPTPAGRAAAAAGAVQLASDGEEGEEDRYSDSSSGINFDDSLEPPDRLGRFRVDGGFLPQSEADRWNQAGFPQSVPTSSTFRTTAAQSSEASSAIPMNIPAMNSPSSLHPGVAQLGTSAPINIPPTVNRRLAELEAEDKRFATTFVPPHLMEQRSSEDIAGALTFSGISPSASLKRERLVQRNAILRSTGFIESAAQVKNGFVETLDTIKEAPVGGLSMGLGVERPVEASALSKALDTLVDARTGAA